MTPFALGAAACAVIAGRLMARAGRWLTVSGLTTTAVGLVATALVLWHVGATRPRGRPRGPLLEAGLGGGMVTSPNLTLTLESVPVSVAGAAGRAADRPAERCGDRHRGPATIYYHVLPDTGRDDRWRHPTRCCLPPG
jgi:MFS family permease